MQQLTATDLDGWSGRHDAQDHLPTLVRRLIMATVTPSKVRIPAAEGVGAPGFDGVIEVQGGAAPYVPTGKSVWELGTSRDPRDKANRDYAKRTKQTSAGERARTTFVFVTSRPWDEAAAWADGKRGGSDGWANVVAFDAQDLATWLETCPGVHGWLATEHLGRLQHGITALRDWFAEWAERTEPSIPSDLLLSGRDDDVEELLALLDGAPAERVVAAGSQEEAVAFIASALLATPSREDNAAEPADSDTTVTLATDTDTDIHPVGALEEAAASRREALLERAIVVHDGAAWRQWAVHEQPLVLVPLFEDPPVNAARRQGHHVLLPRAARTGDPAIAQLHRARAREAWERAGVGWTQADVLARDARRSLASLRRRIGRAGRFRRPAWAEGPSANLLATLLLAGSWRDDYEGDREVIGALTERSWRSVARDLAVLAAGEDAPLTERQHLWEFVDNVDAWDALRRALTSEDLDVFRDQVHQVLAEPDPAAALNAEERRAAALTEPGLPRRRHSAALRRGMAATLALLGAVAGDAVLAGGTTGEERAAAAVRALLDCASAERWLSAADLLPVLAEAAPGTVIDAVEQSLAQDPAPVMALFVEQGDGFGSLSSRHVSLLWALETLALSPKHLPRVAVLLARLADLDPGGRLANRPSSSLLAALHLVVPQSAVEGPTRMQIVDTLRRVAPGAAWSLMVSLVRTTDSGMVLHHGARFRDWPPPEANVTIADVARAAEDLADRIAQDAEGEGWVDALTLADRIPPAARERLLSAASHAWAGLPEDVQRAVGASLDGRVNRHARFRDAGWALDDAGLQSLRVFAAQHTAPGAAPADHRLFSWWPEHCGFDPDTEEGRAALASARADAVRRALERGGAAGITDLAVRSELPALVGQTLAELSESHDDLALGMLAEDGPAQQLAHGFARARWLADRDWFTRAVGDRPSLAVPLLLAADVDQPLLDLLGTLDPGVCAEFWKCARPWHVGHDVAETVAEHLLEHDRPYSAQWVLSHRAEGGRPFPVALVVRAMQAPVTGTAEDLGAIPSPQYVIGRLLDALDAAGTDQEVLAGLEWWYLPALRHDRAPEALHRRLASDPRFFADVIALIYRRRPADQEDADEPDEPDDRPAPHTVEAAWGLLHDWRSPLPGGTSDPPMSDQTQEWVTKARTALEVNGRAVVASVVIGEALSGPATDPDGTWPCAAVRDVLEIEQDKRLEEGLAIGRFNQRGVTTRGPYDGGSQERALAQTYRAWADKVRADWPRAGAVLDGLADGYDADARREDAQAEQQSGQ